MRLFARALTRAGLPVRFSEGFNPHPRMSLPLPRGVGIAADDDLLVVEVTEDLSAADATSRLAEQLPVGLVLRDGRLLRDAAVPQPRSVEYLAAIVGEPPSDLPERIRELLERGDAVVERRRADGTFVRPIDIRPFIEDLAVRDGGVWMRLRLDERGTAKAEEILRSLSLDASAPTHRIRRLAVKWDPPLPDPPCDV
jgi:radical SAM-linked protein